MDNVTPAPSSEESIRYKKSLQQADLMLQNTKKLIGDSVDSVDYIDSDKD